MRKLLISIIFFCEVRENIFYYAFFVLYLFLGGEVRVIHLGKFFIAFDLHESKHGGVGAKREKSLGKHLSN